MAKQCGEHSFTGKLGGTIGYKANGEHLERENGSKEGKAFKKDPRRWRTMYYASLLAQASKAVVLIYRRLPEDQRKHGVYGMLTGKAMSMIKDGKTVEEVKHVLTKQYVERKEPLAMRDERVINDVHKAGSKGEAGAGNRQSARSGGAPIQESATNPTGQSHVVAVITKPYFCSTVSV
jgi:hypothetical protein